MQRNSASAGRAAFGAIGPPLTDRARTNERTRRRRRPRLSSIRSRRAVSSSWVWALPRPIAVAVVTIGIWGPERIFTRHFSLGRSSDAKEKGPPTALRLARLREALQALRSTLADLFCGLSNAPLAGATSGGEGRCSGRTGAGRSRAPRPGVSLSRALVSHGKVRPESPGRIVDVAELVEVRQAWIVG